jgi:hypothetical protein
MKPTEEQIAAVIRFFREKERRQRDFFEQFGRARMPQLTKMGDKAWVVIGGEIYRQNYDGPYGFMNAIHDNALHFFGDAYLDLQEAKPFDKRHPAIQWAHAYIDLRNNQIKSGVPEMEVSQTGAGAAWYRFAYDLFTIKDNARLEKKLREKLLGDGNFQAARHELRVAALAVTAGFKIDFEDEADNSSTHPEFIATDLDSGFKIAVEAKSRHRHGVLGFTGGHKVKPGTKANIRDKVIEAYQKKTALPLYAFVDVNLPPAENQEQLLEWLREINDTMDNLGTEGYADDCPANAVFFTNDPSHYLMDSDINNESASLWMQQFQVQNPRVAHPLSDIVTRFKKAWEQRVSPPDVVPDPNEKMEPIRGV